MEMAHLRLLAILIIATVYYVTVIDTAAVRAEEFGEELRRMALDVGPENLRTQRAIETGGDDSSRRTCYSTPCGWAVYQPMTRRIQYFMKNTCDCADKSYKCVQADDDLSVGAYVYFCRQNTTSQDIESPEESN